MRREASKWTTLNCQSPHIQWTTRSQSWGHDLLLIARSELTGNKSRIAFKSEDGGEELCSQALLLLGKVHRILCFPHSQVQQLCNHTHVSIGATCQALLPIPGLLRSLTHDLSTKGFLPSVVLYEAKKHLQQLKQVVIQSP